MNGLSQLRGVGSHVYIKSNGSLTDISEEPWGTLTINFSDCQNATATLDGVDGQQSMTMVKLAGLQGSELECH